jgi:glycosyltransferase involved in cell wall biosynthesis
MIYPIRRGEPFGLVLAEAMASGLPVIAIPCGAVPEILSDGETGFMASGIEDMADAVKKADSLDRDFIRKEAVRKFSADRMARSFEKLYHSLVSGEVSEVDRVSAAEPRLPGSS